MIEEFKLLGRVVRSLSPEERKEYDRRYQQEWYKRNRPRHVAAMKAIEERDPKAFKRMRREIEWRAAGINVTHDEYDRLWIEQQGRCKLCGTHQGELKKPLHVDPDHRNGRIRGLLCQKCNRGLGHFNDDPQLLREAATYIERPEEK